MENGEQWDRDVEVYKEHTAPGQEMDGSRCDQYTWFLTLRFRMLCLSSVEVWWYGD